MNFIKLLLITAFVFNLNPVNADQNKKTAQPVKSLVDKAKNLINSNGIPSVIATLDADGDGTLDNKDNCIGVYNPEQIDTDQDGIGDSCDNCCDIQNHNQSDIDGDGLGDLCDPDKDNDGWDNSADNCPDDYNPDQADDDGDGAGNVCDGCCEGMRGNVDFDPFDIEDIADLVYMVDYQFRGGGGPVCFEEADVNADGVIDISDLVCLVDHQFRGSNCVQPCY